VIPYWALTAGFSSVTITLVGSRSSRSQVAMVSSSVPMARQKGRPTVLVKPKSPSIELSMMRSPAAVRSTYPPLPYEQHMPSPKASYTNSS